MAAIASIEPGFYRLPLATALTDSMHGEMLAFELNTVRLRDAEGQEGTGYTPHSRVSGARNLRPDSARQLTGRALSTSPQSSHLLCCASLRGWRRSHTARSPQPSVQPA
jgi:hypothetical protein